MLSQTVVSGLVQGCIFGLIGLAFGVVYNAARVVNLAIGDYAMLAAVSATVIASAGNSRIVSVAAAFAILVGAAILTLVAALRPLDPSRRRGDMLPVVFGTLALGLLLQGIVNGLVQGRSLPRLPRWLDFDTVWVAGAAMSSSDIVIVCITVILLAILWFFQHYTVLGITLRAAGINADLVRLAGVSRSGIVALALATSVGVAGAAGLAFGPKLAVSAGMGFPLLLNGFIAAVFGGTGNPYGTVLAGLFLGGARALSATYISPGAAELTALMILLGVLAFRPEGLARASYA